jgi:CRP-like cAMP-binding protein
MGNLIDNLLSVKIFQGFTRKELSEIFPMLDARFLSLKKNAVLIHADELVDYVGVVLRGELAVTKEDICGIPNLIQKVSPKEILAVETACTPSRISPVKITCTQDAQIMTFPYALLSKPGVLPDKYRCLILKNILDIMADSHMRQLNKIELLSRKSLRGRIMLYLAFQAKTSMSNTFQIPLDREEMATYLCVDRSALSRELGRMQKEGLIRFHKNSFHILSDLPL